MFLKLSAIAVLSAFASPGNAASFDSRGNTLATRGDERCPPNPIAGTWQLYSVNVTADGVISYPYGPDPQGFIILTPAPDYTFMEELNASNATLAANATSYPAQANAGVYGLYENGTYGGRTVYTSTIPANEGVFTPAEVLDLSVQGDFLVQLQLPAPGVVAHALWKRYVPGSLSSGVQG